MGKLKYVVVLAISAVIYAGCSKKAQITGPQGATGAQGVQGGYVGNILPIELGPSDLRPSFFKKSATANYYYYAQRLYNYNNNLSYMISGYVTKVDTGVYPTWFKMPDAYIFGNDELYCSIGNDSVYIWYYNSVSNPVTAFADTVPVYKIVIIPSQ